MYNIRKTDQWFEGQMFPLYVKYLYFFKQTHFNLMLF